MWNFLKCRNPLSALATEEERRFSAAKKHKGMMRTFLALRCALLIFR